MVLAASADCSKGAQVTSFFVRDDRGYLSQGGSAFADHADTSCVKDDGTNFEGTKRRLGKYDRQEAYRVRAASAACCCHPVRGVHF